MRYHVFLPVSPNSYHAITFMVFDIMVYVWYFLQFPSLHFTISRCTWHLACLCFAACTQIKLSFDQHFSRSYLFLFTITLFSISSLNIWFTVPSRANAMRWESHWLCENQWILKMNEQGRTFEFLNKNEVPRYNCVRLVVMTSSLTQTKNIPFCCVEKCICR